MNLYLKEKWVRIEVRDNGPGIPPEDLPHIFERFYRVQKDRARQTGGSGLGLAICQLIASAHGGTVEAESKPGKGSTFRVNLPLNANPPQNKFYRKISRRKYGKTKIIQQR